MSSPHAVRVVLHIGGFDCPSPLIEVLQKFPSIYRVLQRPLLVLSGSSASPHIGCYRKLSLLIEVLKSAG